MAERQPRGGLFRTGGGKAPKPSKGYERGRARAERANQAGDDVEDKQSGKSPGRLSRAEMRALRGSKGA